MLSDGGCRASGVVPRLLTQQFAAAERENRLLLRFCGGSLPASLRFAVLASRRGFCGKVAN